MADGRLQVMRLENAVGPTPAAGIVGAQRVRRLGLADAGNVVVLALDGQQRDARIAPGRPGAAVHHLALRQGVATNTVSTVCR
jgi:hypothetical protein